MKNQIYSIKEYTEIKPKIEGIIVYDGDGDGTSAAAIWLMANKGDYIAITNEQKDKKDIVNEIFKIPSLKLKKMKIGVFDLPAEENFGGLEKLLELDAEVDFLDHHTKISLPTKINNYSRPDSLEITTSSIAYSLLNKDGLNEDEINKAIHLTILGLANDGKQAGFLQLFPDLPEQIYSKLLHFGKVLNYGANKGNVLDFVDILKGFSDNKQILDFCLSNRKINEIADDMEITIKNLNSRIIREKRDKFRVYSFPSKDDFDRLLSRSLYSSILNEGFMKYPNIAHIGVLQISDGQYRLSIRAKNALELAMKVSEEYGAKAKGRVTGAGFDTKIGIETVKIISILGEP